MKGFKDKSAFYPVTDRHSTQAGPNQHFKLSLSNYHCSQRCCWHSSQSSISYFCLVWALKNVIQIPFKEIWHVGGSGKHRVMLRSMLLQVTCMFSFICTLHVCQCVLNLMFILPEDWISHLQTSWKSLRQRWPQSDPIYKHNPHFHRYIAPMDTLACLQPNLPFSMGLTGSHIWWWQLVTVGLSLTICSATRITRCRIALQAFLLLICSHGGSVCVEVSGLLICVQLCLST